MKRIFIALLVVLTVFWIVACKSAPKNIEHHENSEVQFDTTDVSSTEEDEWN